MPIKIVPTAPKKGSGGMDIATRRDALVDTFVKEVNKASKTLSDRDISRAITKARGMIGKGMNKKAGGGKIKKKK